MAEAFPTGANSAPASATKPLDPRQLLTPGWYWAFLDPAEASAVWTAFSKANPAIRTTKTVGTSEKGSWVLFQVQGTSPVVWSLPGFPTKALKGADTEYSDIIATTETPDASADFLAFWPKLMAELGTAGQMLLWGGVAVVLYKLYSAGGAPSSSGRSRRDEDDYEEREEHHVTIRSPRSGPRRTGSGTLISRR